MKTLYYASTLYTRSTADMWDDVYKQSGPAGKFWIDSAICYGGNRFVARTGKYSLPWDQVIPPGFEMPVYDPSFNMTFGEVSDARAEYIRTLIRTKNAKIALFYSGGIDSVVALVSLIKNLTPEELKHIYVCLSFDSVIEYPEFFKKYISGKMNIIDSASVTYTELIDRRGFYTITADLGDAMFGTDVGIKFYNKFAMTMQYLPTSTQKQLEDIFYNNPIDPHFSVYEEAIVAYLNVHRNPDYGRHYYNKLALNIKDSPVPIHSIQDFFWWQMFNTKYMHCSMRAAVFLYTGTDREQAVNEKIIHWFNDYNYQQWSMNNNNNGQKIRELTPSTYKYAARNYINEFFPDVWFRNFKLKLMSLKTIWHHKSTDDIVFGMNCDYENVSLQTPNVRDHYMNGIINYKLDWM
jgi:tetrahydromethanopterin S-methyltransferase subunit B